MRKTIFILLLVGLASFRCSPQPDLVTSNLVPTNSDPLLMEPTPTSTESPSCSHGGPNLLQEVKVTPTAQVNLIAQAPPTQNPPSQDPPPQDPTPTAPIPPTPTLQATNPPINTSLTNPTPTSTPSTGNENFDNSQKHIQYAGVNIEKMKWQSASPGKANYTPSMKLWETFTAGHYVPSKMEQLLSVLAPEFNTVRIMVGARHLVHPEVGPTYRQNLVHTLKLAKEQGVWVVIGIWPAGVYPYDDFDNNATADVTYYQYDPYFYDPAMDDGSGDIRYQDNFELIQKPAMRTLANLISSNGLSSTVLYVDLRNEINGHIGSAYDDAWNSLSSPWGYVPDKAGHSFRTWLTSKYGTIEKLNDTWGGSYTGFEEIPIFRVYSEQIDGQFGYPARVSADVQSWLISCLRDWVTQLKAEIKQVDSSIMVGQSTTNDDYYESYPVWELSTRSIYRQYEIGDLVDVLDYHIYQNSGNQATLSQLKANWPNKLFIAGEFYGDIEDKVRLVNEMGGDGLLFWSAGCSRDYKYLNTCTHYWDDWSLTETGMSFRSAILPYITYHNP